METKRMSEQWLDAGPVDDVGEEYPSSVVVAGKELALYRVGEEIYATDNLCTHGNARLCDGYLEGYEIECPLHQGRFDIRDGRALCAPLTTDVRTYPVKLVDGRISIGID
jgi:naphthalene 1,2-dioxygenase system ferredoxin subunit